MGKEILAPFLKGEVDAIYVVYNEFKSAMTQKVVVERLLPVRPRPEARRQAEAGGARPSSSSSRPARRCSSVLVPMYVDISLLRALYESHGERVRRAA